MKTKEVLKGENIPVEVPSGADFSHAVMTIRVIGISPTGILEGTTTDAVNANEQNEHNNVQDREFMPIPSNSLQHTCLTRITFVA